MTLIETSRTTAVSLLDNIKTGASIISTSITALALIIAGLWAYFKFVRGRTFKPRLEVKLRGWWRIADDRNLLQVRIILKNIGTSKITLMQEGTGLQVSTLSPNQQITPGLVTWTPLAEIFSMFVVDNDPSDQWIEPGEAMSEEVVLDLHTSRPVTVLLEVRLECRRHIGSPDEIFVRKLVPEETSIQYPQSKAAKLEVGEKSKNAQAVQ
jgi:hypothetical protein